MKVGGCPLCDSCSGKLVFQAGQFRIIQAAEAGFPAFYRVIWTQHVAEFSDLNANERALCMEAVVSVERVLREYLKPAKINLAALGNMVPHLHWHVIARFKWDSHFPAPVWAAPQRAGHSANLPALSLACDEVNREIALKMAAGA